RNAEIVPGVELTSGTTSGALVALPISSLRPRGYPSASTGCPAETTSESPIAKKGRFGVLMRSTARSTAGSVAIADASVHGNGRLRAAERSGEKQTLILVSFGVIATLAGPSFVTNSALLTTWSLVST